MDKQQGGWKRVILIILAIVIGVPGVLALSLAGVLAYRYLRPESTPAYPGIAEHFKYGSIGSEVSGLPYWVWKALPDLFPLKETIGLKTRSIFSVNSTAAKCHRLFLSSPTVLSMGIRRVRSSVSSRPCSRTSSASSSHTRTYLRRLPSSSLSTRGLLGQSRCITQSP